MPPQYPFVHPTTGLRYRLSSDQREYVFANGQRTAIPSSSAAAAARQPADADSASDEPPPSESSSLEEQNALTDAAEALTLHDTETGNGTQNWSGADPRTGIQTQWEIGPTQQAPATREQPSRSYNAKLIRSNGAASYQDSAGDGRAPGPSKRGFKGYQRSTKPAHDFAQFRVVELLAVPPPSSGMSMVTGGPPPSGPNDLYITRMRRFVIIGLGTRQDFPTFKALPIKTYDGEGVGARHVVKSHHTIIHTTKTPPKPMKSELPQKQSNGVVESGMRSRSIRVKTYDKETMLDPIARLDFFDLHEFDYNHYFKAFGTVHEDSRPYLLPLYNAVRAALELATLHSGGASAHVVTSPGAAHPPASAPATGSSQGPSTQSRESVVERITQVRQLAVRNEINPPAVSAAQLDRFAEDPDAFRAWMSVVRSRMEAVIAQRQGGGEEEEDEDSDSDEEE